MKAAGSTQCNRPPSSLVFLTEGPGRRLPRPLQTGRRGWRQTGPPPRAACEHGGAAKRPIELQYAREWGGLTTGPVMGLRFLERSASATPVTEALCVHRLQELLVGFGLWIYS